MAAEYNLIPAAQYDRLMKLQQKLDNDKNNAKEHLKLADVTDDAKDNEKKEVTDMDTNGGVIEQQPPGNKANENGRDNGGHSKDATDSTGKAESQVQIASDKDKDKDKDGPIKDVFKWEKRKKTVTPIKLAKISSDNVDEIVSHFAGVLKKKVKRLVVYLFKFGRDIDLKHGALYYKKKKLGGVVLLLKSLFEVIPIIPGLKSLRKLFFILSVPSDLFILTTTERAEIDKNKTAGNKIEWLKY